MLALINRVWYELGSRTRQHPAEESIDFAIPGHDLQGLQDLVKASPGLRLESKGWGLINCTVSGNSEAVRALVPQLQAWQMECGSRDAW